MSRTLAERSCAGSERTMPGAAGARHARAETASNQTRLKRVWSSGAYDDFRAALLGDTPPEVRRGCSMSRGVF